jgi:hypothetical protein
MGQVLMLSPSGRLLLLVLLLVRKLCVARAHAAHLAYLWVFHCIPQLDAPLPLLQHEPQGVEAGHSQHQGPEQPRGLKHG